MEALALARLQFAANITFHILFPTITLALAWVLVYFKTRADRTRDERWLEAYRFWIKVFALSFAMGVVSGVTMSFQFGTNWPNFMLTVGNIAGPLLGYEVLTAFFLEATFLGVMLFGRGRVPNGMHTLATWLVAIGTTLSAFWILALNSWMHTPAGFEMIDGQAHVQSWSEVIFNPSLPYRFTHMLLASGLTVAFLVAGISAYRHLHGDRSPVNAATLRSGVHIAALLIPVQILVGDLHGLNTLEHQPAKIAAIEAVWHDEAGAPLLLFAVPDEATESNRLAVGIPKGASLILTHAADGVVPGLARFGGEHPPVAPLFFAFRLMVGIGVLMLVVAWLGTWRLRAGARPTPLLARVLVAMTFAGWIAVVAGWYVTEIGRQPWLVQGLLTTADAAGPVGPAALGASLTIYLTLYALLLSAYVSVIFHMARKAALSAPPAGGLERPLGAAGAS